MGVTVYVTVCDVCAHVTLYEAVCVPVWLCVCIHVTLCEAV